MPRESGYRAMDNRFIDAILAELSEEKAESLSRAGTALEDALHALASFEPPEDLPAEERLERRRRLVWLAAQRVTNYIVQREACGLVDSAYVLAFYKVPRDVIAQLGKRALA
jgi:hypothetical protein